MVNHSPRFEQLKQIRAECRALVLRRAGIAALTAAVFGTSPVATDRELLLQQEMFTAISRKFSLMSEQILREINRTRAPITILTIQPGKLWAGRVIPRHAFVVPFLQPGGEIGLKTVFRQLPSVGRLFSAAIRFGVTKAIGDAYTDACFHVLVPLAFNPSVSFNKKDSSKSSK